MFSLKNHILVSFMLILVSQKCIRYLNGELHQLLISSHHITRLLSGILSRVKLSRPHIELLENQGKQCQCTQ